MRESTTRNLSILFFLSVLVLGFYTLISYLGTQYHSMALMGNVDDKTTVFQSLSETCGGSDARFCIGLFGFFSFIAYGLQMLSPFLWYGILCLVVWAGIHLWKLVMHGESMVTIHWAPWKILALGVIAVWLFLVVLSKPFVSTELDPVTNSFSEALITTPRFFLEPSENSYRARGAALESLKQDYLDLQARGCLNEFGENRDGDTLALVSNFCVQGGFFTRVVPQILFILLFVLQCLTLGRAMLKRILREQVSALQEAVFSFGLGAGGIIVLLWITAVAHLFIMSVGWVLTLGILGVFYQDALYWIKSLWNRKWTSNHAVFDPMLIIAWVLISYLAINFLTVVRPFPIGWDDVGSYVNRPKLLVSYGQFIFSMPAFEWTYLTSLGFLLFGYGNYFSATASLLINWTAGLFAVAAIIAFARHFLGGRNGTLSGLLYYALPLVGHFSFADMKIDNAVFAYSAVAALCIFIALFSSNESPEHPHTWRGWLQNSAARWFLLGGIFVGLAFSTKVTAVMVFLALAAVIAGATLHWSAYAGAVALMLVVLRYFGGLSIERILSRLLNMEVSSSLVTGVFIALIAIGIGTIAYGLIKHKSNLQSLIARGGLFTVGFLLVVLPWVAHNNILWKNIIPSAELIAPNNLSPMLRIGKDMGPAPEFGQEIKQLSPELAVDMENAECISTAGKEELDRYWGFEEGPLHYLTLPWRMIMNLDSTGYYVTTMPALLLFPLMLLLPAFWFVGSRWLRWLGLFTVALILQWMLVANGVPWYGIGMFLGLIVFLEAMFVRAPDVMSRWAVGTFLFFSFFICLSLRMWQHDIQRNMFQYAMGIQSAKTMEETTIPDYDDIAAVVGQRFVSMPEAPYVYRVGTFIPYFLPRSLSVIGANDNQLDTFNCLYQERDSELTLKRLKALGFNSFILDLNAATIEADANGTLHRKLAAALDFLNDPKIGLSVVVNNPEQGIAFVLFP